MNINKYFAGCLVALTLMWGGCSGDDAEVEVPKETPSNPDTDKDKNEPASSVDPNFQIYLCFGQSNMEGNAAVEDIDKQNVSNRFLVMGVANDDESHNGRKEGEWYTAVPPLCRWNTGLTPADYFGRTMIQYLPETSRVGIVMVAMGGAGIDAFDKSNYQSYYSTAADWLKGYMDQYDGNPYARLVEMGRKAKESGVIKGILMHQGETNNMQQDWPGKVKKIYNDLLADLELSADTVPLLIGEMLTREAGGVCYGMNDLIATMPQVIPTSYVVSAADCPGKEDGLHFTAEGYRELGQRYARKMLQILGVSVKTELKGLYVDGRFLKDATGKMVNLHGFAQTYSPWFNRDTNGNYTWTDYNVDACLKHNKSMIDKMLATGWEMDFVRLHMDPYWSNTPGANVTDESDISAFDETRFSTYLDQVFIPMAEYAISKGMYVVMRPPGVCPEQIAVGDAYQNYLVKVWRIVASHNKIKSNPNIMFELANEPINIKAEDGSYGSWGDKYFVTAQQYFQKIVNVIRDYNDNVIWVPGLAYQQSYDGYVNHPVVGKNIAYAIHLYPGWMGSDGENGDGGSSTGGYEKFQNGWDSTVGALDAIKPLMVTEMDWAPSKYNASWGKAYTGTAGGIGFGANFKYIVDNAGNVSWLLFTSPEWLSQFKDVPGTEGSYTFLNDPEACPWPVYHWFQEYAKDTASSSTSEIQSLTVENVESPLYLLTGSNRYLIVKAAFADGTVSTVTSSATYRSTDADAVKVESNGKLTALKDGTATIVVTYTDTKGNTRQVDFTAVSETFPLRSGSFNPNIWETGSFDEATHTLITGQWGFGGWEYTNGIDLSNYRYLVAELGNDNSCSVSFRLFDEGYWNGACENDFGNSRIVKVDLQDMYKMVNGTKTKMDPKSLKIIGFWSSGGKPIVIDKVYLLNE